MTGSRNASASWLLPVLGFASILVLWHAVVVLLQVPEFVAPTPLAALRTLVERWPLLLRNFWPTAVEALLGFLLGNTLAVLTAIVFVHSRLVERAYFPVAVFFNTIPVLALAPILVLIFGLGMLPKIVIAAVICFFPTLVNMIRGLEAAGKPELELMRVLNASRLEVFWRLRVPRSLPFLFAALRIASTTCVVGAIVGEWIGANDGLGALIIQATFNYQSPLLYATLFVSSGLALLFFGAIVLIEKRVLRWS